MRGVAGKPLTITGLVGFALALLLAEESACCDCLFGAAPFSSAGQLYGSSTCTFTCLATMVGMLPPLLVPPLVPFVMKNDDDVDEFSAVRPIAKTMEM